MPLYELFCLARPALAKDELFKMIQKVGKAVYSRGGVVTEFTSYGQQNLAYKISGVHGKYTEVSCLCRMICRLFRCAYADYILLAG
jgi:ribosomal protein S6